MFALWIYDRTHETTPRRPHALLRSNLHSEGFFNSQLVIANEPMLRDAASDLIDLFVEAGGDLEQVAGVVGPQTGATKLAGYLCSEIICRAKKYCFTASPAKSGADGKGPMVFDDKEYALVSASTILPCEDVVTTAGSVMRALEASEKAGAKALPYILVLVNRSGLKEIHGRQIIALIEHHMPTYAPEDCPLCKAGSEAIHAKGENWARLTATD